MGFNFLSGAVSEAYRQIERVTVIAEPAVEDHVASRGKSAHGLLYRNRLLENKCCDRVLQVCVAVRTADDDQRHRV